MVKCELCEKEFGTYGALQQHYSSKHPGASPPQDVERSQPTGSRTKEKKRKTSLRRKGGRGRKKLILASVLVVIVLSVGVYALYFPHSTNGTVGVAAGDLAPDIPVNLVNGTTTTLGQFYGHPVLLWLIATWCPGCQQTAPILASTYYSQLHSAGVTLLTVQDYGNLAVGNSVPQQYNISISQFADQYGGGSNKPGWLYGTTTKEATYTYNPQADLDIYYLIGPTGTILRTSGAGLYADIQGVMSTVSGIAQPSPNAFPFQCLSSEQLVFHIHPWLRIVINGQNVTIPAAIGIKDPAFQTYNGESVAVSGSCFEPIHTHDTSGIIHIESAVNIPYTLDDFFNVWKATYGSVTFDGSSHPLIFTSTDILGFKADSTHKIVMFVDGQPSTAFGSLVLNQLDYCSASSSGPPCYPTAVGNPYYNGQQYPYGTGHTIVIEYITT